MAAAPARSQRRRRSGSFARPINARTYRGTWLLVGIPLLIAAFSLRTAPLLPAPALPPTFESGFALDLARDLAGLYPDRRPGSNGGSNAARWVADRLRAQGLQTTMTRFRSTLPGGATVQLVNVEAEVPSRSSDAIVVMAHRDNAGKGPGGNDNASGTAALIELAHTYAASNPCSTVPVGGVCPAHRIVFLSTDAGAYGGMGAEQFVRTSSFRARIAAVVNLDSIGSDHPPRIVAAGLGPRSASPALQRTAAARILEAARAGPGRSTPLAQLLDLGFPFTLYEQGLFVRTGISAVTLTTGGVRPPDPVGDTADRLNQRRLGEVGRAGQELIASIDQGLGVPGTTTSSIFLGSRFLPGWAVELVLIACLLPFVVAAVDLFARCRRRGVALAPAWRSYRSRLGFWLWVGGAGAVLWAAGLWPSGPSVPPAPTTAVAGDWPVVPLIVLSVLAGAGWLVIRERLLPRRRPEAVETVAGHTVALLALAVIGLAVVALNPFALVYLLPSLHAWLWLPQLSERPVALRIAVLAAGLLGPAVLVGSFAFRFGLGLDAPWYLTLLVLIGYVPAPVVLVTLAWLAAGGQLAALAVGRYAPYPARRERPPRGPIREVVRRVMLTSQARRRRTLSAGEKVRAAGER